jgi:pyrimidine-nucleoside phosphorylase
VRAIDIIRKKRDGGELTPAEIDFFVRGTLSNEEWTPYQLSALLMAVFLRGMTTKETAHLTQAMANSGTRLDLSDIPGPKVDKHSTGGVGDKTSLILGPLAAACGVVVPMISGRGLGHSGGTLDKLESIPGFRVGLSESEFRTALRKVKLGLIGQTSEIAPADKALYALRDVTSTVESIPLITASILSKKLAEGISGLVMDVKCGRGAFMKTRSDAKALADSLVRVGTANGLKMTATITSMDAPLGQNVGNSLEVLEAIDVLKGGSDESKDLIDLSVLLAARMIKLAGLEQNDARAEARVRSALNSGAGLEVFRRCIEQQGGDPHVIDHTERLPFAPRFKDVKADRSGFIGQMDAELVGIAAMLLGAGRNRAEDTIDHSVGIIVRAKPGEQVRAGDTVFEVRYNDGAKLASAQELLDRSYTISEAVPEHQPLILEEVV